MKAVFDAEVEGFSADGIRANDAAMLRLRAKMGAHGGRIIFGAGRYYFASGASCRFDAPVILEGQGASPDYPQRTTTALEFAAGQPGVTLGKDAQGSSVRDLMIHSRSTTVGADDGLLVLAHGVLIQQVIIQLFGRDGIHVETTAAENANNSTFINVRAFGCRRRGFHVSGVNSNVLTFINADATWCQEYGYYNDAAHCLYLNAHADVNAKAAYCDAGSSNHYFSPYTENNERFVIDARSNGGRLICGYYGAPTIDNQATAGGGWIIESHGCFQTGLVTQGDFATKQNLVLQGAPWTGLYMANGTMIQARTKAGEYEPCFTPRWVDNSTRLTYGAGGFVVQASGGRMAFTCDENGRFHGGAGGFIGSRGTTVERNQLVPEDGLEWYNTDTGKKQIYSRGLWVDLH